LPEITDSSEDDHVDNLAAARRSQAASPLAGRSKAEKDIRIAVSGHSAPHTKLTETVDRTGSPLDALEEEEIDETEDEGSDIAASESDEPDEWFPASSRPRSTTAALQKGPLPHLQQPPSPVFEKDVKAERTQARRRNKTSVSELAHDLGGLNLAGEKTRQQAARPTGTRQSRRVSESEEDGDEESIIVVQNSKGSEGQKKKKR
jgi:hypothetical protein